MDTYKTIQANKRRGQVCSPSFFRSNGKRTLENEANFWNYKGVLDKRTGEICSNRKPTPSDIADQKLKDANFASDLLDEEIKATGIPHSLVFITITLPSELQGNYRTGWNRKGKAIYSNTLATYGQVEQGAINLEVAHRDLYQTAKDVSLMAKFEKVIEPHKSWTPHSHCAFYLPTAYLSEFKTRIDTRVKALQDKGIIGTQIDIAYPTISEGKTIGAYIKKYLKKSIKDFNYELLGWYRLFGIVQFRNSNPVIPKKLRTKIYNATRGKVDYAKEGYESLNRWVFHNVGYELTSRTTEWLNKAKPNFKTIWKHNGKDSVIRIYKKVERMKIGESNETQEAKISTSLLGLKVFLNDYLSYDNKWFSLITLGIKQGEDNACSTPSEARNGGEAPLDTIIDNCRDRAESLINSLILGDEPPPLLGG